MGEGGTLEENLAVRISSTQTAPTHRSAHLLLAVGGQGQSEEGRELLVEQLCFAILAVDGKLFFQPAESLRVRLAPAAHALERHKSIEICQALLVRVPLLGRWSLRTNKQYKKTQQKPLHTHPRKWRRILWLSAVWKL